MFESHIRTGHRRAASASVTRLARFALRRWWSAVPLLALLLAVVAGSVASAASPPGNVIAWGALAQQPSPADGASNIVPAGLTNATAVSAGFGHQLALKSDATVVAWGERCVPGRPDLNQGQCNVPPGLSGVTAIAAGNATSFAVADGGVRAWGGLQLDPTINAPTVAERSGVLACPRRQPVA